MTDDRTRTRADPANGWLPRCASTGSVVGAAVVVGALAAAALLSKLNEVRYRRLPRGWRRRVRALVAESAGEERMAREARDPADAYRHAVQGVAVLRCASQLAGRAELAATSGYDVDRLEEALRAQLSRNPARVSANTPAPAPVPVTAPVLAPAASVPVRRPGAKTAPAPTTARSVGEPRPVRNLQSYARRPRP